MKKTCDDKSFFACLLKALMACEASSFRSVLPKVVLSHTAPTRSPSRSNNTSRRSSYELTHEWEHHVHYQVDKVLVTEKTDVVVFFLTLIETILDGEVSQQPIKVDGLAASFVKSPDVLSVLADQFSRACKGVMDSESTPSLDSWSTSNKQFVLPLTRVLISLSAFNCVAASAPVKESFDLILGQPALLQVLQLLSTCVQMQSGSRSSKWDSVGPSLSRLDLLLLVANLVYKSPDNQKLFKTENG